MFAICKDMYLSISPINLMWHEASGTASQHLTGCDHTHELYDCKVQCIVLQQAWPEVQAHTLADQND